MLIGNSWKLVFFHIFPAKSTEFLAPVSATVANARCDATGATCARDWALAPGDQPVITDELM